MNGVSAPGAECSGRQPVTFYLCGVPWKDAIITTPTADNTPNSGDLATNALTVIERGQNGACGAFPGRVVLAKLDVGVTGSGGAIDAGGQDEADDDEEQDSGGDCRHIFAGRRLSRGRAGT